MKLLTSTLALSALLFSSVSLSAMTARMGTSLPETHPQTLGAKKFAELVEKKTNGEIKVKVFSNAMLGNDVNMTSMLQAGTLDFTAPSTATLASLNQDFSVISLPFLFKSNEQADKVLDSKAGKELLETLSDKNLVGLQYWENGFRHITNSKRPITSLEDMDGLKIRVMQNNLYIDLFNGLEANAVPMPVNELFTALETRTVDGQENPFTVINAQHFYEVQNYLSLTGHAYDAQVLLGSQKFFNKISEEQKQLVLQAAREATLYQRNIARSMNQELLEQLESKTKVNTLSSEEVNKMEKALQPVIEKYEAIISPQVISDFDKELKS